MSLTAAEREYQLGRALAARDEDNPKEHSIHYDKDEAYELLNERLIQFRKSHPQMTSGVFDTAGVEIPLTDGLSVISAVIAEQRQIVRLEEKASITGKFTLANLFTFEEALLLESLQTELINLPTEHLVRLREMDIGVFFFIEKFKRVKFPSYEDSKDFNWNLTKAEVLAFVRLYNAEKVPGLKIDPNYSSLLNKMTRYFNRSDCNLLGFVFMAAISHYIMPSPPTNESIEKDLDIIYQQLSSSFRLATSEGREPRLPSLHSYELGFSGVAKYITTQYKASKDEIAKYTTEHSLAKNKMFLIVSRLLPNFSDDINILIWSAIIPSFNPETRTSQRFCDIFPIVHRGQTQLQQRRGKQRSKSYCLVS